MMVNYVIHFTEIHVCACINGVHVCSGSLSIAVPMYVIIYMHNVHTDTKYFTVH